MKKNPMKIELHEITVRELFDGYKDDGDDGVVGYGGNLDIRPPFQRAFVYKDKQRNAVIETINKGFPLNVMYWGVRDDRPDRPYEVLDGQQRTISICQYVKGDYSVASPGQKNHRRFHNLQDDEQERILDYELQVYRCEGTASEKLEWFKIINIAGEELTEQEIRNAVYAGPWVEDAKKRFSRPNVGAHDLAKDYINKKVIRQEFLETAIKWAIKWAKGDNETIEKYMDAHRKDSTAIELWTHFQSVINRVEALFTVYRASMKGVDWGGLYERMQDKSLDPKKLEAEVARLVEDDEVQSEKGIYSYVLTRDERHLNLRAFGKREKSAAYERQGRKCNNPQCPDSGKEFDLDEMEADHIDPWSKGGKTVPENCQVLCQHCNRRKSDK